YFWTYHDDIRTGIGSKFTAEHLAWRHVLHRTTLCSRPVRFYDGSGERDKLNIDDVCNLLDTSNLDSGSIYRSTLLKVRPPLGPCASEVLGKYGEICKYCSIKL
ncbi:MAG TPA: hypothetical protein VIH27_05450, partial [Nitrososphaerales archaeon]